jgi:hypothetical protein
MIFRPADSLLAERWSPAAHFIVLAGVLDPLDPRCSGDGFGERHRSALPAGCDRGRTRHLHPDGGRQRRRRRGVLSEKWSASGAGVSAAAGPEFLRRMSHGQNGSRLLTDFVREGALAGGQSQAAASSGECDRDTPACDLPEGLHQVLSKDRLKSDAFYFDYDNAKIYLADIRRGTPLAPLRSKARQTTS